MKRLPLFLSPILAALLGAPPAQCDSLTPEETRGQKIYLTGKSPAGGDLEVFLGDSEMPIPGHLFACVNCHGADGKGVPEGGVKPSNITWHELSNPYGTVTENHRRRAPYTGAQVLRAIGKGIDSSGNPLEISMPRYHLDAKDGKALVAYLKKIDRIQDPGVSSGKIRLGVILPPSQPDSARAEAVRSSLQKYFDRVNREGGIYRRQIELVALQLDEDPVARTDQWIRFVRKEELFTLLAPSMEGVDPGRIGVLLAETGTLSIAPLSASPPHADIPNPNIFYFYPGPDEQTRALLQFSRNELKLKTSHGVISRAGTAPSSGFENGSDLQDRINQLKSDGFESLLVAGDESDCEKLIGGLSKQAWNPVLLLHGSSLTSAGFGRIATYPGDVYVAFPSRELLWADEIEGFQKSAIIAADVFRTLLLQAGRRLTRQKIAELLEKNRELETGWTGPLTFGPNRRLGARGAFVGKVQSNSDSHVSETTWVELEN